MSAVPNNPKAGPMAPGSVRRLVRRPSPPSPGLGVPCLPVLGVRVPGLVLGGLVLLGGAVTSQGIGRDRAAFPATRIDQPRVRSTGAAMPAGSLVLLGDPGPLCLSVELTNGAVDHNGDGDALDLVAFHVGEEPTNLGVALGPWTCTAHRTDLRDGSFLALRVSEQSQGKRDQNGDGDHADWVAVTYDANERFVRPLGLPMTDGELRDDVFVFRVSELEHGGIDLNGDGDAIDQVLHAHVRGTPGAVNLQVAVGEGRYATGGGRVLYEVSEAAQGGADLNGDGDAVDHVVHVHDVATDTATNLGFAAPVSTAGRRWELRASRRLGAFLVDETEQGSTDHNFDGDFQDQALYVVDFVTGAVQPTGLAAQDFEIDGSLVVLDVLEQSQGGQDLNGNGTSSDRIAHVYDAVTGSSTNLGVTTWPSAFHGLVDEGRALFRVQESWSGVDLNVDGDVTDWVAAVYDSAAGGLVNLGLVCSPHVANADGLVVLQVSEDEQGGVDLNGDGDTDDDALFVIDLRASGTIVPGISASGRVATDGELVAFHVSEADEGQRDLNGDGDAEDLVLHLWSRRTGLVSNTRVAVEDGRVTVEDGRVYLWLTEAGVGEDRNGDGDLGDAVVHVVDHVR